MQISPTTPVHQLDIGFGIEDADLGPRYRLARRSHPRVAGGVILGRQIGRRAAGLGHAIDLDKAAAEGLHRPLQDVQGNGRGAIEEVVHRGEVAGVDPRIVEHHLDRGGHQHGLGDPEVADRADHRAVLELAQHHVERAGIDPDRAPAGAADVKHRHGDQARIAGLPPVPGHVRTEGLRVVGGVGVEGVERAVAELDALGPAGGAAGVELDRDVVGRDLGGLVGVILAPAPGLEGLPLRRPRLHGDDLAQGGNLGAHPLRQRRAVAVDEQKLGLGVVGDVDHLRFGQAPVHRREDRAHPGGAEQQLEEPVGVLAQVGDPRTGLQPLGQQAVGHLGGVGVELRVGRRHSLEEERRLLAARPPMMPRRIAQGLDLGEMDERRGLGRLGHLRFRLHPLLLAQAPRGRSTRGEERRVVGFDVLTSSPQRPTGRNPCMAAPSSAFI